MASTLLIPALLEVGFVRFPVKNPLLSPPKTARLPAMLDVTHAGATLLGHEVGLPHPPAAAPSRPRLRVQASYNPALIDILRERVFSRNAEYAAHGPGLNLATFGDADAKPLPSYFLFAAEGDSRDPDEAFRALRWG